MKQVQLSISGCLGPCDIANVVAISTAEGTEWYGNLNRPEEYEALLEWAQRCADSGRLPAPPAGLESKRFERWRP